MKTAPWTISDRKINIALVGCGRIAKNHAEAIQQHNDRCVLKAVCDTRPDVVSAFSQMYGGEAYTDLDELLLSSDIDLVSLCTPSGIHPTQTVKVASYGKHVLTEKPMAVRWQDGLNMVQACEAANVRLFVVKQNRLNATLQLLKRAIDENRFGKIYMVNVNVFWTRPQSYYDQGGWRGTWSLDGGAFMNQASHYVDLLRWLLGPIASVQAMMSTLARKIEAEDTGVLNIRWRNGALGSMSVTMLAHDKNFEGSVTILGEKGTVRVGGVAVNEIQHWAFDEPRDYDESIRTASYDTTSVYGFGHPLYYANVLDCLQGKAQPLVDGREGLSSLEVLIAAYRAARDQTTVHLPLEL